MATTIARRDRRVAKVLGENGRRKCGFARLALIAERERIAWERFGTPPTFSMVRGAPAPTAFAGRD